MRVLIQRVARAEVRVADTTVGTIERGLLVLVGVREGDTVRDVEYLASKVVTLRIFEDALVCPQPDCVVRAGVSGIGGQRQSSDLLCRFRRWP